MDAIPNILGHPVGSYIATTVQLNFKTMCSRYNNVRSGTALIQFSSTLLTKYIFCHLKYTFGWK